MKKKPESISKNTRTKRTPKEVFGVVSLPEYEKDLSHLMTEKNRRPEQEEKYRILAGNKLVSRKLKK